MQDDAASEVVTIGKIGAPYGIKGWIKIISFTDPADGILGYHRFMITDGTGLREIEMDQSRAQGRGFVGHIRGCDDRDQCRDYTGRELLIAKTLLPELEQGAYYWYQLEGLKVVTVREQLLGEVDHLLGTGVNDVMVIRPTRDSIDDEERLVPYVSGRVVKDVDLERQLIRVDWETDF